MVFSSAKNDRIDKFQLLRYNKWTIIIFKKEGIFQ